MFSFNRYNPSTVQHQAHGVGAADAVGSPPLNIDPKHTTPATRYTAAMRCPLYVLLICLAALLPACSSAPVATDDAEPASYAFAAKDYPAVFDAAVEVLRDHGFRPARKDYRFGTITTYAKESPTALEFWIDDATTPAQRRADTLNAQFRKVTLHINKLLDLDEAVSSTYNPPSQGDFPDYILTAEVLVQRIQRPARYLTHSARGSLSAEYKDTPTHLRVRGIDGDYAQPLTRDPHLEARLVEAIRQRAQAPADQ